MQVNITGHHVDVTDALRSYVDTKLEKLERHFDHIVDVHVILTVEKQQHKAEASLHLKGHHLYAECIQDDMYASIDGLIDKMDRQVVKQKEKFKDHHQKEAHKYAQM
ncbi:MAG: ribosome-associated translation inhibitor RaiA [Gammaproteobacteria bacterium]|nr:ribosome-associated translation inhibitor RaiA [Gammaproteobacteria bacterium]